ncbi:MAG: GH25 family lysozyme [Actinomycetota bacterium]
MADDARGVDVSNFQGDIDWAAVAADGISFGFAKATESTTFRDPYFAKNWSGMAAHGVARGAYHFFSTKHPGADQANFFLSVLGDEAGDLPPVIDIETGSPNPAEIQAWLDTVERALGVRPMIYASLSFANDHLGAFGDYPLWIAEYNTQATPTLPSAWSTWQFWQYSDKGSVNGIAGNVDVDRHNGPLGAVPAPGHAPRSATQPTPAPNPQPSAPPEQITATTSAQFAGSPWVISAGDTLASVAHAVGITVASLAGKNGLATNASLTPGETLTIP